MAQKPIGKDTLVLDFHEDSIEEYDDPKPKQREGSYLYVASKNLHSPRDYPPIVLRTVAYLQKTIGLVENDQTREGKDQLIVKGVVSNANDGSVDQFLAVYLGAELVVATEIRLKDPNQPPLAERVAIGKEVLDIFLEEAINRTSSRL